MLRCLQKIRFLCKLGMVLLSASVLASPVYAKGAAQTQNYEVLGSAPILNANVENARQKAIQNSLVSAVDLAAADILPLQTRVNNFKLLNDLLYIKTDDFVQGYRVLTEAGFEGTYRVLVEATVSIERLRSALHQAGVTAPPKALPRVLLLISEKRLEDLDAHGWWQQPDAAREFAAEEAMRQNLLQKGFAVVSHDTLPDDDSTEPFPAQALLSDSQAVALGRRFEAQIVIVGSATAGIAPNTMGADIKTYRADIDARALRVDTAEEIGGITRDAVAVNADHVAGTQQALSAAGMLAANELATMIMSKWEEKAKTPTAIVIRLAGAGNLANFINFRRVLRGLNGVKQIQVSDLTADTATIDVAYDADAHQLANALMRQTFDHFGLRINNVSDDTVDISLQPETTVEHHP